MIFTIDLDAQGHILLTTAEYVDVKVNSLRPTVCQNQLLGLIFARYHYLSALHYGLEP